MDCDEEEFLSPKQVAYMREVNKTPQAVYFWIKIGVLRNGQRVKLPARRVVNYYQVKRSDVAEFLRSLN